MTDEKGHLLEEGSQESAVNEQHHISTSTSPTNSTSRMGRFAFILFLMGLLTFNNVRSQEAPSIEQRVGRILSETPLIGRYKHVYQMLKSVNRDRWPR